MLNQTLCTSKFAQTMLVIHHSLVQLPSSLKFKKNQDLQFPEPYFIIDVLVYPKWALYAFLSSYSLAHGLIVIYVGWNKQWEYIKPEVRIGAHIAESSQKSQNICMKGQTGIINYK